MSKEGEKLQNPFVGSKIEVKEILREPDFKKSKYSDMNLEKEDENERFIIYKNGLLVRKVESETKYFPNKN